MIRRTATLGVLAAIAGCVFLLRSTAATATTRHPSSQSAAPPSLLSQLAGRPVFAVLPDGTLAGFLLERDGEAQSIQMQTSPDGARTWTTPRTLLTLPSDSGGWGGPEVLVDNKGEVHLILLNDAKTGIIRTGEEARRRNMTNRRLDIWHAMSTEGRTKWLAPTKIWEGYTGSLNSIVQLKTGRIVLPFSYKTKRSWAHRGDGADAFTYMGDYSSTVLYSDDDGRTWALSPDELKIVTPDIRGAYGAVEPVVLELKDHRVWMLIRSQMGRFYESYSPDGAHWSAPRPTAIISSDSPAGLARLVDGRIVMLWNECVRYPYAYGGRQVLHGAISEDDGQTWRGVREVMRDSQRAEPPPPGGDFGTAYPFPIALPDGKILFTSGQGGGRRASYVLDPAWLLQTSQETDFSNGLDDWSSYGTRGVEMVETKQGSGHALRISRSDPEWPAGAVWNFPDGAAGSVTIEFSLEPGFQSLNVGLTDQYSTPFDDSDYFYNLFNLPISSVAPLLGSSRLKPNQTYKLTLAWNTEDGHCRVSLDGRVIGTLRQSRLSTGVNYLRLHSTADTAETGGMRLLSVIANVSPSGMGREHRAHMPSSATVDAANREIAPHNAKRVDTLGIIGPSGQPR